MIRNFPQAEQYLNSFVRQGKRQVFQGEVGLEKMRRFLSFFNSPQNTLKVIHVAGTAGKGSTCYLISRLLTAHKFKVGLHLSPHLTDIRERFQINNRMISKKKFVFYLKDLYPIIEKLKKSESGYLSYFMISVGLAFYIFNKEKVDYAVVETGLGGLYDATNIIDRQDKISVITKIGFDHMEILGDTLEKIAYQKAMIINSKSQVITIVQNNKVINVIKKVAKEKKAKLILTTKQNLNVSLFGDYQKENASLSLKTLEVLSNRDRFKVKKEFIKYAFKTVKFLGRFDIKKIQEKTVILDGAHNQLKMEAFCRALSNKYPEKKFHFLIAFKKGKDYMNMLRCVMPLALRITITSFFVDNQDLIHLSEEPEVVKNILNRLGFYNINIINQPGKALKSALKENESVVITGSLYLLGEIYRIIKQ